MVASLWVDFGLVPSEVLTAPPAVVQAAVRRAADRAQRDADQATWRMLEAQLRASG